jgi:hypothetical protein
MGLPSVSSQTLPGSSKTISGILFSISSHRINREIVSTDHKKDWDSAALKIQLPH